ncbi:MAG: single-stranded-DNA-specific exonuclease RecJ [Planctomycetota bacterium]|jgi:single-stranded-DNA-specific exonuclease
MSPRARRRSGPASNWRAAEPNPELAREIAEAAGVSPVAAQVLVNRGIVSVEEAKRFLRPSLSHLEDPSCMTGMAEAASRVHEAVRRKERILIFGDYDADGVTASALLYRLLGHFGADREVYLPSRMAEGYGLSPAAAEEIVRRRPGLVVTVDCGIRSPEEVARLREEGIDTVITDHHPPGEEIPEACAVVNPRRADCSYPFKELAGVGVAFKLAWEIARRFARAKKVSPELREFLLDAVGLVAIGTVADVASLVGENRTLVAHGMVVLSATEHPGISELMAVAGLDGGRLSARDLAFGLGPRLNAAGRMGSARAALDLLLEDDPSRARALARDLDRANRERRRIEGVVLSEAEAHPEVALPGRSAIVLGSEGWHPGVLGIVASRLAEKTGRPAALVRFDGDDGRGSARSAGGVDVARALEACREHLEGWGGHARAAGVRLRRGALERFREEFDRAVSEQVAGAPPEPALELDAEIPPSAIGLSLAEEIDALEPFGEGNPRPVFAARGLELGGDVRPFGPGGRHFAFKVTSGRRSFRAVAFGFGERRAELARLAWKRVDLAFELSRSKYSGPAGFELHVRDLRPAEGAGRPGAAGGGLTESLPAQ